MEAYNVLVLMEKDKNTGFFTETIDSYTIQEGLEWVESIYLLGEDAGHFIYLVLTTADVEDWQYYGIYDLYNEAAYDGSHVEVLDGSGDYNPRWILKFPYTEERAAMEGKINSLIALHRDELLRILPLVEADKEKYMREMEEE